MQPTPSPVPIADHPALPADWQLPAAILARIGQDAGPQRAMLEDGHLLIILHLIPGPTDHRRTPLLFWRNPSGIWNTSGRTPDGLRHLKELLETYEEKIHDLETAEASSVTATAHHHLLEEIGPILRASRGLHRALQQAREFSKDDKEVINCRDRAVAIERNAELLLQDAQHGLDFIIARQAEAQAESARQMALTTHKLNLMAALFLPLGAISGFFGMEIRSGLANTPQNFLLIIAGAVALGLATLTIVLLGRRPKP